MPDEDALADIEDAGQQLLQSLGYSNYEVSAWSGKSDAPCQHNMNYWQFGDYLAIGAGAHGKVSIDNERDNKVSDLSTNQGLWLKNGIYRFSKSRQPKDYVNYQDTLEGIDKPILSPKMVGWQAIDNDELVSEFMLNALRLHEGVIWSLFEARTGLSYDSVKKQVRELIAKGLLVDSEVKLQTTQLGKRYLNQILRAFL